MPNVLENENSLGYLLKREKSTMEHAPHVNTRVIDGQSYNHQGLNGTVEDESGTT